MIDDVEKSAMVREARALLADVALARPNSEVGRAYAHFSVDLDFEGFEQLLAISRPAGGRSSPTSPSPMARRESGGDAVSTVPARPARSRPRSWARIRWKRWSWAIEG